MNVKKWRVIMFKKIYMEITNICNLKCKFCPETSRKKEFMSVDNFEEIVKKIHKYTNLVCLHVKGEPLLHNNLEDILKILENYYSVEILNSMSDRHLVRITCAASSSKALIEGWVEKRICNVWLWTMEQGDSINIYEGPTESCHYIKVDLTGCSNVAVPVLSISKDGWYYISIMNGDISLSGWTKNVCSNIYGSCEHGNPYSKKLHPL